MSDDLYRRALLRLAADASAAGRLPHPNASASLHNPACGDRITVELALAGGRIAALAHQTQACVLTQAAAALLATDAPGQDAAGLKRLEQGLREMLAGGPPPSPAYAAFDGVAAHPGRQTCVLLPVRAALAALEQAQEGAMGSQGQV